MAGRLPLLGFVDPRRSLNRVPSPVLALALPFFSVMLGSLTPAMPLIASAPILPPFGLLLLLAWRQVRPGVLPIWSGLPLGMFDDLFSGQPFGSAMMLWSLTMVALELIDMQFPWRTYLLDWSVSAAVIATSLVLGMLFAGSATASILLVTIAPQVVLAILLFPLIGRLVARLDHVRLTPVVELR